MTHHTKDLLGATPMRIAALERDMIRAQEMFNGVGQAFGKLQAKHNELLGAVTMIAKVLTDKGIIEASSRAQGASLAPGEESTDMPTTERMLE